MVSKDRYGYHFFKLFDTKSPYYIVQYKSRFVQKIELFDWIFIIYFRIIISFSVNPVTWWRRPLLHKVLGFSERIRQ